MTSWQTYSLFGLRVRSEVPLPELLQADGDGIPDVIIGIGKISEATDGRALQPFGAVLVLNVPAAGRYRIAEGREIIVEPASDAPAQNVRLFLLGSAFGLLLHQRGLLPLHANAIEVAGAAVAFMGKSGAGKSTLAAWFQDQGHRIIADDVCVVDFDDEGKAWIRPGVARLRLWREALQATGRDAGEYQPSFIGEGARDKFDVPLVRPVGGDSRLPLAAVYLLERGEAPRIEPLAGIAAFDAASANTYRGGYVATAGSSLDHWSAAVRLVRSTPMFKVERRWSLADLHAESARLLHHAEELIAAG